MANGKRLILGPFFYLGDLLTDGVLHTYDAGTTDNQDTFSDRASTTTETNPLTSDSNGIFSAFFTVGLVKLVLKDSLGTTISTWDNVEVLAPPAAAVQLDLSEQGHCRLVYTNTTTLTLTQWNGSAVMLKTGSLWEKQDIPAAGLTLGISGLSAATLYYIYLYNDVSSLKLETSTTAYAADAAFGFKVRSNNETRLLVGMAYLLAGPIFADADTTRNVRSWFNDDGVKMRSRFTADRSTASATFIEINSEIGVEGLVWNNEMIEYSMNGIIDSSDAASTMYTAISEDSTTAALYTQWALAGAVSAERNMSINQSNAASADGHHNWRLLGKETAASGTVKWDGDTLAAGTTWMVIVATGRK